jgi:hypothetical protein
VVLDDEDPGQPGVLGETRPRRGQLRRREKIGHGPIIARGAVTAR